MARMNPIISWRFLVRRCNAQGLHNAQCSNTYINKLNRNDSDSIDFDLKLELDGRFVLLKLYDT